MKRTVLLLVSLALWSCDLVPRFGGAWVHNQDDVHDAVLDLGAAGSSTVRLVLGQYGPEVAGHLKLPELSSCPCVYVSGTTDGDVVRFEPTETPGCTLFFKRGEFSLETTDRLYGTLWVLPAGGSDVVELTPAFDLSREYAQSDLGTDDLKGCTHE